MFSDIWTLKTIPKMRDRDQMGPKRLHREAKRINMEHIGCPSGSQGVICRAQIMICKLQIKPQIMICMCLAVLWE